MSEPLESPSEQALIYLIRAWPDLRAKTRLTICRAVIHELNMRRCWHWLNKIEWVYPGTTNHQQRKNERKLDQTIRPHGNCRR